MIKYTYDLKELAKSGEIDVKAAVANYGSEQIFFNMLTNFSKKSLKYLQYTPVVVTYTTDVREEFLAELEHVKSVFAKLGLKKTIPILEDMGTAACKAETKVLSDKLVQYKAKLEMINNDISVAQKETNVKPTILAVDDMPEILISISNMLQDEYKVIAVTSVKAGMKAVMLHTPDIFLLDIEMPEEDGYEMARQIRDMEAFAETPILFLTGKSKKEYVLAAMQHGGKDYILKPVNKEILIQRLRRSLNEED